MEDVNENQVDSTEAASSTEVKQEEQKKDVVAYESFQKSVSAEKAARKRAKELEEKLEAIENARLEKEGKHDEIIQSLRTKVSDYETTLAEERKKYLWNSVKSAVKTAAVKNGCSDPDKLLKLLDNDDFSTLKASDGDIDPSTLNALIEKSKKENWFLFSGKEVKVNDVNPTTKIEKGAQTEEQLFEDYINSLS